MNLIAILQCVNSLEISFLSSCCWNNKALFIYYFMQFVLRRPTNDSAMEAFIRNKYEKKKFIAKVILTATFVDYDLL